MRVSNAITATGVATAAAGGVVAMHTDDERTSAIGPSLVALGGTLAVAGSATIARRGWAHAFDAKIGARALSPYEIRRADVKQFLEHSALRTAAFHAGSADEIVRLSQHGAGDLSRRGAPGLLGAGFYTTLRRPDRLYGPATAAVAIDARRPLVTKSFTDFERRFGPYTERSRADVRDAVRAAGHDSILLDHRVVPDWAVAIDSDRQVRVIVADEASDRAADAVGTVRRGIARALGAVVPPVT